MAGSNSPQLGFSPWKIWCWKDTACGTLIHIHTHKNSSSSTSKFTSNKVFLYSSKLNVSQWFSKMYWIFQLPRTRCITHKIVIMGNILPGCIKPGCIKELNNLWKISYASYPQCKCLVTARLKMQLTSEQPAQTRSASGTGTVSWYPPATLPPLSQ